MNKSKILLTIIVALFLVIIVEVVFILNKKTISSKNIAVSNGAPTKSFKEPEEDQRQTVNLSETNGLESAEATLVYRGKIIEVNSNSTLTLAIEKKGEETTLLNIAFDSTMLRKTRIKTGDSQTDVSTFGDVQGNLKEGDTIRIVYHYNILENIHNSIVLEKIL